MFTPGSGNKFLFATLGGGAILEVGDYSNRGYYSNKYGRLDRSICLYIFDSTSIS